MVEKISSNKDYREIAARWHDRLEKELDEYLTQSDINLDSLVDFIWERGILDHIAPTDSEEFEAREKLDKDVFRRDNPELYWRIMYSAGNTKNAVLEDMTLIAGYVTQVTMQVIMGLTIKNQNKSDELFPKGYNSIVIVSDRIIKKAREELIKIGVKPHDKLIPISSFGKFKGVNVKISRYTHDGLIALETENYEDHKKLGELNNYKNTVSPQKLNPAEFSLS